MGLPMGLQFSITAIGSMAMQSANNSLGTVYVSGFAAASKIKQLTMCPFDAFGGAVSTFLSQNYGAKKEERIHEGFVDGMKIAMIYAIIALLILNFLGRTLSMLFLSANEVKALDASALYLARIGLFYPVLGILYICRMSLQGLGYSGRAIFGGVLEMFARCLVAFMFVPKFGFDAITFTDQAAWVSCIIYLIPMVIHTIKSVQQSIRIDRSYEEKGLLHIK